ncbi:MATE family efflux transporter [uncultured Dubosiella sp.]|uniref:MATE family efflux transporter n=1 Tax=uncultured Dubosiella sp. TaxID=1937011 RepID=UPI0034609DF9
MKAQVIMTEGPIWKKMILFAFPIFLGQLFQQLYNTADSLIVGNFLGSQALAAVSSSGNLIFLMIGFFNGMSMGAGVVISRLFGAGLKEEMTDTIYTTVALAFVIGLVLTALGTYLSPILLEWMQTPSEVLAQSNLYFSIYFLGSLGLVLYNFLSGIMRAVGDSTTPLYFLILSSLLNIVLDIVFITRLDMDVDGAAYATIISQFVSAFLSLLVMLRKNVAYHISLLKIRFYKGCMTEIIRYGVPTGIQNSIISIANVVVQSNINAFGAMAMAGCGAYSKVEGFAFLPIMSFNMAISTFVSSNIGANKLKRAYDGAKFGIWCSVICAQAIGMLMLLNARPVIALFDPNPDVISFGAERIWCNCWFYFLLAYSHAVASVLRGGGKPTIPMYVMLICWCALRIGFLMVTGYLFHNIWFVYWVYPLTWGASSILFFFFFRSRSWLYDKRFIQQEKIMAEDTQEETEQTI